MHRSSIRTLLVVAVVVASLATACGDDGDPQAFCTAATDAARFDSLMEGLDPTDVEGAITAFRAAQEAEEDLLDDAPEAVQADVSILVRFFEDLAEGLEAPEATAGTRPPIYDELKPRFDQVEAASSRIELYVETNC